MPEFIDRNTPPESHQVGGDHYLRLAVQPWEAMESWMGDAIERELATAFALASSRGTSLLDEAKSELAHLRKIVEAAELACGLLWMTAEWRQGKTEDAYKALLEALGGSGSKGLGKAIQRAIESGAQVDAPPGCDWIDP